MKSFITIYLNSIFSTLMKLNFKLNHALAIFLKIIWFHLKVKRTSFFQDAHRETSWKVLELPEFHILYVDFRRKQSFRMSNCKNYFFWKIKTVSSSFKSNFISRSAYFLHFKKFFFLKYLDIESSSYFPSVHF